MCRFISIAVEDEEKAKLIFAGYSLWGNENKSFGKEIPNDFAKLWVTDAHCSCAYYSKPYDPELDAKKLKKKYSKPKYRKKGWSTERIEREVEKLLKKAPKEGGLSQSLFDCFKSYTSEVGSCYCHIGWYSGDQTRLGLNIYERSHLLINSGSVDANEIHDETLYTFT